MNAKQADQPAEPSTPASEPGEALRALYNEILAEWPSFETELDVAGFWREFAAAIAARHATSSSGEQRLRRAEEPGT